MKTKVNLLLAVCVLLFSTSLSAQTTNERSKMKNMTIEERANFETEKMKNELALTQDQVSKIKEINLKYAKQRNNEVNKLKEQGKTTHTVLLDSEHENMKTIFAQQQNEKNKELRAILTPNQYESYVEKYTKMKNERDSKKKEAKMLIDFEF